MIAIKSDAMKQMPEYCDDCVWYGLRPHPHKGWTELCELMGHCMDDDQEEEWIYDGNGRPKACPLIEVADTPQTDCDKCIWSVCNYNKVDWEADTPQTERKSCKLELFDDDGNYIEPQTETEIAKGIVHKMIDDAVIAEDAYPDLRQKMHDAVDEYEPQTERFDSTHDPHKEWTDCPWK